MAESGINPKHVQYCTRTHHNLELTICITMGHISLDLIYPESQRYEAHHEY